MFGIGFFELIVIGVVALVFIGPKRLPDFMKQAGRLFVQMRRTANDVRSTFDQVVQDAENEIRREKAEALMGLIAAKPVSGTTPSDSAPLAPHNQDGTLAVDGAHHGASPSGAAGHEASPLTHPDPDIVPVGAKAYVHHPPPPASPPEPATPPTTDTPKISDNT